MSHVFISYASEDREQAVRLRHDLLRLGVTPWLDVFDLVGGQDWRQAIRQALRTSSHVVLLMSRSAVTKSGYVQREIRDALEILAEFPPNAIFVVPVRLENVTPLHEELARLHWIDLFPDYAGGLRGIAKSLGVVLPENDRPVAPATTIGHKSPQAPDVAPAPSARPPKVLLSTPKTVAIRSRLSEPINFCRRYRENVDLLVEAGMWSYTSPMPPSEQLTSITDTFIQYVRSFAEELRAAADEIDAAERGNVARFGMLGAAGNLLGEVRAALHAASVATDRLVEIRAAVRAGLSLPELQQTPQYGAAVKALVAVEDAIYAAEDKREELTRFAKVLELYGRDAT